MTLLPGRLFTPAVDVIVIQLSHNLSQGWALDIQHRHSGEEWGTCERDAYRALTGEEVLLALDAAVGALLQPSG